MALLLGSTEAVECSKCGATHTAQKQEHLFCYAGEEHVMKTDPETGKTLADSIDIRGGHAVLIPYGVPASQLGWGKRLGRLPICPEHRLSSDEDWP